MGDRRTRRWHRGAALGLLLLVGVPAMGAPPEQGAEDRLRAHLEVHARASREGRSGDAELALGLLEEENRALGARNAILPASWLLWQAEKARLEGGLDRAAASIEQALRLAPDLPAAHWARIGVAWEEDPARIARLVPMVVDLVAAWRHSFRNQVDLALEALLACGLGLALTAIVVAVLSGLRHLRNQAHDIAERLPSIFGPGEVGAAMLAGLLLPGALGFGWSATLLLMATVPVVYQSVRERLVSALLIVGVVATPVLVGALVPFSGFNGSRVDLYARVLEESQARPAVARLEASPQPSGLACRLIALDASQRGEDASARTWLKKAVEHGLADAATLNDLAVASYRTGAHDEAEQLLRRAAGVDPQLVVAHLNLSLIAGDRADFESVDRAVAAARRVDPSSADRLAEKAGLPTERRLMWAGVDRSLLWDALWTDTESSFEATRGQLVRALVGGSWVLLLPWVMVGFAFAVLSRPSGPRSVPCARCGEPAPADAPALHCSQCQSVFIFSGAIPPATRMAKERQVRRHRILQRMGPRVLACIPGVGDFVLGRVLAGTLQIMVAAVVMGWLIAGEGPATHAWHLAWVTSNGTMRHWLGGGLLVAATLYSLRSTIRRTA